MQPMMDFSVFILGALADFLLSPPIIYVVGLVCLCFLVKVIKMIIN